MFGAVIHITTVSCSSPPAFYLLFAGHNASAQTKGYTAKRRSPSAAEYISAMLQHHSIIKLKMD